MPPTINRVENSLERLELFDVSSPRAPFHIFVMANVNSKVNRALLLVAAATKDAGPSDNAQSKMIIANCAVMNSLTPTNKNAGLRLLIKDFASFHAIDREVKIKNVDPRVNVLNP